MDAVRQYLRRRKSVLQNIHPQWDYTEAEIDASTDPLKRNKGPICIPPSWDCIKTYVGALNKAADGYDREFHRHGLLKNIGEMGEAAFLDAMQNSNLGGLLIGNIDSRQMLDGRYSAAVEHVLPEQLSDIVHEVLNQTVPQTKKYGHRFFEMDFVLFHPHIGIFQIEVKTTTKPECCKPLLDDGLKQLRAGKLRLLFRLFCHALFPNEDSDCLWDEFNAGEAVFFPAATVADNGTTNEPVTERLLQLKEHTEYANILCPTFDALLTKLTTNCDVKKNYFDKAPFKEFAVLLACYRPDFFISPIRCVLQVYNSIIANDLCSVNYYQDGRQWSVAGRIELLNATTARQIDQKIFQEFAVKTKHIFHQMIEKANVAETDMPQNMKKQCRPNANCHKLVNQCSIDELAVLCQEQFTQLMTRQRVKFSNGIQIQPEVKSALNTRHSKSKSGLEYLQDLQKKRLIRHSNIVFPDGRKDIYFTKEQLNAIDVFDENGKLCNMRQLIIGPPGSGKSLVLLMKLFILKQVRRNKKLGFGSWWKHNALVEQFVTKNECKVAGCCRLVEFPRKVYPNDSRAYPVHRSDYDLVFDECWSSLQLERLRADSECFLDAISITVVTGGSRLSWPRVFDMDGLIETTPLTAVFRSTICLQRFLGKILGCELTSGHSFFGIPVETRHFADRRSAEEVACARIDKLMSSSYLNKSDIGMIAYPMPDNGFNLFEGHVQQFEITDIPSLEFPIVVAVCIKNIDEAHLALIVSRAICHLIIFKYDSYDFAM